MGERIVKYMEKEKCVNCGISGVKLYPGQDGHLHCADHTGMIFPENHNKKDNQKEEIDHEQTI